jgi:metal-responsive CopG/Arc/MetJ family transcriptional regulator
MTRRRVKIGATIDPNILSAVDAYIRRHPQLDRSAVIDDALRLWWARQQEREMEQQYAGTPSDEEQGEREAWRRIQRESVRQIFNRRPD